MESNPTPKPDNWKSLTMAAQAELPEKSPQIVFTNGEAYLRQANEKGKETGWLVAFYAVVAIAFDLVTSFEWDRLSNSSSHSDRVVLKNDQIYSAIKKKIEEQLVSPVSAVYAPLEYIEIGLRHRIIKENEWKGYVESSNKSGVAVCSDWMATFTTIVWHYFDSDSVQGGGSSSRNVESLTETIF